MTHSPETPGRQRSPAEKAMAANASSRDRQGKRQDRVTRDHHTGMMGDGAQNDGVANDIPGC